jgi:hypothetical protein
MLLRRVVPGIGHEPGDRPEGHHFSFFTPLHFHRSRFVLFSFMI